MAAVSGTFNFLQPQSVQIIEEAFELASAYSQEITQQMITAAQRTLNFTLQQWVNKGLNLFTVRQSMISLVQGQASYNLPPQTSAILEATIRTSVRNLGGTPFSSAGGNASLAFDNNSQTACTQTAPNGYISYNWGQAQFSISMVGIQSNVTTNYTLVGEYSFDGATWVTALTVPVQSYPQGINQWFVVPVPVSANYFRVRETGGATLNIQELYFNTNVNDTIIQAYSRSEYVAFPNKNQISRPAGFYFDRQIVPILNLYPAPSSLYNNLYYTWTSQPEDIGSMQNSAQVAPRFLDPLMKATAHNLAVKYRKKWSLGMDEIQYLKSLADEAYMEAAREDRERVPLRIYGDYMQGWTQL